MVAVSSAAMRCLRQLKGSETIAQQDSNGRLAVKLLFVVAAAPRQAVVPDTLEPAVTLKPINAGREAQRKGDALRPRLGGRDGRRCESLAWYWSGRSPAAPRACCSSPSRTKPPAGARPTAE